MNTKKALAGLLGLLGSFTAFSFFTGCLLPRSLAFLFTDNLQNPQTKVIFHKEKTIQVPKPSNPNKDLQKPPENLPIRQINRRIERKNGTKGRKKNSLAVCFLCSFGLGFRSFHGVTCGRKAQIRKKNKTTKKRLINGSDRYEMIGKKVRRRLFTLGLGFPTFL